MYLNLSLSLHRQTSPTHHGKAVFMRLYSFQKKVLPILAKLLIYDVPYIFKSVGSFHCLCISYDDYIESPLSSIYDIASLCSRYRLCAVLEFGKILVF